MLSNTPTNSVLEYGYFLDGSKYVIYNSNNLNYSVVYKLDLDRFKIYPYLKSVKECGNIIKMLNRNKANKMM